MCRALKPTMQLSFHYSYNFQELVLWGSDILLLESVFEFTIYFMSVSTGKTYFLI